MNILVIGNNINHARLFGLFSEHVYLAGDRSSLNSFRKTDEISNFGLIESKTNPHSFFGFIKRIYEIKNWVKKYQIALVFSNRKDDMVCAKLAFLFKKRKPLLIVTFHNSYAWMDDKKVCLLSRFIDVCADGCIALSNLVYNKLKQNNVLHCQFIYLPNTIDYRRFIKKTDYSIQNVVKIVYTGVICPAKNQSFIVDVVNELKKKYSFLVYFVGDFVDLDYKKMISEKICEDGLAGQVFLLGRVDHDVLRSKLSQADIYFSASKLEMSPYNILEAKAAGLPILASNVSGQSDLIADGFDGLLFFLDSLEDAKKGLVNIISNKELRQRMGMNANISVSSTHSFVVASKALETFVSELSKHK